MNPFATDEVAKNGAGRGAGFEGSTEPTTPVVGGVRDRSSSAAKGDLQSFCCPRLIDILIVLSNPTAARNVELDTVSFPPLVLPAFHALWLDHGAWGRFVGGVSEKGEVFVRLQNVHQRFGDNHVLRGINLEIYRGETLVLLGGSGGGKSVLMKHFCGLLCPVEGTIEVDGETISNKNEREMAPIRKKVSMMFQGGALFDSLNVAQNVAFPLRESGRHNEAEILKRVQKALDIVRLPDQMEKMPSDLSGGMRKRVALARAVVEMPLMVLYDEPHAGLDPVTADSIDHLIKDLQRDHGITNVVVTHEMRSVFRIADRVIFMKDGQIYFDGTPDELRESKDQVLRDFVNGRSRRAAEWDL